MSSPNNKMRTQTSKSRSQQKSRPTTPNRASHSPSNLNKKPTKMTSAAIVIKMKGLRDRLCSTLDAYILILETNAPMRCLEHNSVLSLYCETEQKLLCANCVYRSNNHRLHKVFPIEKCYKQISRDVDQISRQVEREINWADLESKTILEYFKEEQKNMNQALVNLSQIYDEIHYQLNKSFEITKTKIISGMDIIFTKKQAILLELEFFRDIYTKNRPITTNEQLESTGNSTISQYHLLFNHLIGGALIQFGKLEGSRLHDGVSLIKNIQKQTVNRLKQLILKIESWKQEDNPKYNHVSTQDLLKNEKKL